MFGATCFTTWRPAFTNELGPL